MRIAFLGCGAIARAHAKRLKRFEDVELAFASRDGAKAAQFARELGGAAYGSYAEALEALDVDIVAVVTPPDSHQDLAVRALAAGKHVVLEKPPLLRASDFTALEAASAAAGKRVFVAENYRYKPSLARLRGLLADGVIGDVLFVQVNAIKRQASKGDWRDRYGALFEGGIHWVDFFAALGSALGEVRGVFGSHPGSVDPDRSMLVTFAYGSGAVGTLAYSWEVPATARGLRLSKIYGREGSITFETNGLWILLHGKKTRFYVPGLRDLAGYRAMWTDFVRAWREDTDAAMTLAHARRDLEIVEEAYATAKRVL